METDTTAPLRLPAYQNGSVKVYLGDARDVLRKLPADSVDCVVTSPPYWGLERKRSLLDTARSPSRGPAAGAG
jgi:DNA modification methylase